jgi:hypothetical protein
MPQLVHARPGPQLTPQPEPWSRDLDEPHAAVWDAVRHLFPAHADVTQANHGCMVITWLVRDPQRRSTHYAAPLIIRIEPGLLLALWTCGATERRAIAGLQEETVREAIAQYDPHSRIPTCDMIVLGDG